MSQENVEIVRAALEAFRHGRVDEALERIHPQMVSRRTDPDNAVFHGRDGLLALMADWTEGFEEWSYRAEEFFEGPMVTRFSIFSDRDQAFVSVALSSEAARPSP